MKIEVLGAGCAKCIQLYKRVSEVAENNGIDAQIQKVEDIQQILSYGVMMTPALVIDGVVVSKGKIPGENEILGFLTKKE